MFSHLNAPLNEYHNYNKMDLPFNLDELISAYNNAPKDEFFGFSPNQLHNILYEPYSEKSPIQIRDRIDDEIINQIPLFRTAEEFLKIIHREGQLKMTSIGAMPVKIVAELYNKRILLDDAIETGVTKLWNEDSCHHIHSTRIVVQLSKLVKLRHSKMSLTKRSQKLLESNNRTQIFREFFQTFTDKFLWAYNDGFEDETTGQLGWALSIFMLYKYGHQKKNAFFYGEKYMNAFPMLITHFDPSFSTPRESLLRCYSWRTFYRFFLWFGFVTLHSEKRYRDPESDLFQQTDVIKHIFKIDYP